jgi:hypothetical protein
MPAGLLQQHKSTAAAKQGTLKAVELPFMTVGKACASPVPKIIARSLSKVPVPAGRTMLCAAARLRLAVTASVKVISTRTLLRGCIQTYACRAAVSII